jgi:hypothetical protein
LPTLLTNITEILNSSLEANKEATSSNKLDATKPDLEKFNQALTTYAEKNKSSRLFIYNTLKKLPLTLSTLPLLHTTPPMPSRVTGTLHDPSRGLQNSMSGLRKGIPLYSRPTVSQNPTAMPKPLISR